MVVVPRLWSRNSGNERLSAMELYQAVLSSAWHGADVITYAVS